ncbi:MAG: restriction endonuclease subunit S [Thermoanaerobaculia bacterium]|nr:restriction endonuclease subunit S [Thermoanaerobaculia bacterium]
MTKGLDPNLPMKDSGVEWLGEIPAHWRCFRLKYLTPQLTVGIVVTPSKYYVEKGPGAIPCPRSFNVKADFIDHNDMAFISEESNRLHAKSIIRAGDLVAVRTGQPGTTAVVDDSLDGANCVDLIIIRQSSRFDSRFLCHYLNSAPAHYQYGSGAEGALQQHFNVETAKELLVPLPPRDEQTVLVAELDRRLEHLGRTLTAAARQEDVLHEYRQALISVAVTGKIEIPVEEAE